LDHAWGKLARNKEPAAIAQKQSRCTYAAASMVPFFIALPPSVLIGKLLIMSPI